SHLRDQATDVGRIVYARKVGSGQQHIKQFVIAHLEQQRQGGNISISKFSFVVIQKSSDDQIVFQQASTGPPTQTGAFQLGECCHYWGIFLNSATNQEFLDLADSSRRIKALGTDISTVHDGVAPEQAIGILEVIEAFCRSFVAGIDDESVSLQQPCGTHEFVGVPP